MRIKALAAVLTLSWASVSLAQAPSPFKFEMHGFASGTLFMADGGRTPGSGGLGYISQATQSQADKLYFGTDVRQSRFVWSVTGPQVFGGATPKALLEIDWFGGQSSGNSGSVHLLPRMRLAYAELNWGAHRIIFGQNTDVIIGNAPVTLAHQGAPYVLSSGFLGFRRPGVFGYHTFGDLKNKDGNKFEFAWEIGRSMWTDAVTDAGTNANCNAATASPVIGQATSTAAGGNLICQGEASGLPMVQARLAALMGQNLTAFVGGTWSQIDRSGAGLTDASVGPTSTLTSTGVNLGGKAVVGALTLQAHGYYGKNLSPLYGGFGTIQYPTAGGDGHEYGAWGQAGFNFTKEMSLWQFVGFEKLNDKDFASYAGNVIGKEVNFATLAQYRDGGYAIGLEWTYLRTYYVTAGMQSTNQIALTGLYYF